MRILSVLLACGALGCAAHVVLAPAPSAARLPQAPAATFAEVAGVRVIARAGEWPGEVDIEDHVTPLDLTIENNSQRSLRIRYADLALIAPDGRHFAALPLYAITGSIVAPVVDSPEGFVAVAPRFHHHGFLIAPFYAPLYPGLGVYSGPFLYDPYYYGWYSTYWTEQRLPTPEMRDMALPEGVLQPGGHLQGYAYFQHVNADEPGVTLRLDLVDAVNGETFGSIVIPFAVKTM